MIGGVEAFYWGDKTASMGDLVSRAAIINQMKPLLEELAQAWGTSFLSRDRQGADLLMSQGLHRIDSLALRTPRRRANPPFARCVS